MMEVLILLLYILVKEVSSAIVCEESRNVNGLLLGFLGLDNQLKSLASLLYPWFVKTYSTMVESPLEEKKLSQN